MRIDVKKYLFVGLERDKKSFFKEAQKLGIVHFIPIKKSAPSGVSQEICHTTAAIKILNSFPETQQEELEDEPFANDVIQKILQHQATLDKISEEQTVLNSEIERIKPFGHYLLEDLHWIEKEGHCKVQFFSRKCSLQTDLPENFIYIATENDQDYFVAINSKLKNDPKMIEIKPQGSLNELEQQFKLLNQKSHALEKELKNFAKYNAYLHQILLTKLDREHLLTAENCAALLADDKLFGVEGWVPEDKVNSLHNIAQGLKVYISEVAIEPNDIVPTYLENQGLARIGEDLVNIYDTPSTDDSDPSLWVLFFFALFFSMIIGDGGYGLVLLLAALYFKWKSAKVTAEWRRFINLSLILAAFCMVWGLLTTSFFGVTFSPDNPIRKVSVLTWLVDKKVAYHFQHRDEVAEHWINTYPALAGLKDPKEILTTAVSMDPKTESVSYEMMNCFSNDILLELALLIGVIHVSLSFIRNFRRNLAGVGWILFLWGAYLYFPAFLGVTSLAYFLFGLDPVKSAENGYWMMFLGIGLALAVGVIKNKIFGLLECMNILQIFGDIMSYLRLYALGLSGALVVSTINELAANMNVIFAILLLIFAHSFNLALCIMGGVIHGLRLNFLEWYHYCFDGGGRQFIPLKENSKAQKAAV